MLEDITILLTRAVTAQVVGMSTLQVLVSTSEGGHVGFIEDVVVDSTARGRGERNICARFQISIELGMRHHI